MGTASTSSPEPERLKRLRKWAGDYKLSANARGSEELFQELLLWTDISGHLGCLIRNKLDLAASRDRATPSPVVQLSTVLKDKRKRCRKAPGCHRPARHRGDCR